jgi:tetratricopeptide (TPR) repeat protein
MSGVSYDDLQNHLHLLRKAPEKFLAVVDEFIRAYPQHAGGYFNRHFAWARMGHFDKALDDLRTALKLNPNAAKFDALGKIYYRMGRFADAIEALNQSAALDPHTWAHSPSPLFRADCHARLGNEAAALEDCKSLPDDHRLPYGLFGVPKGDKREATAEIRRRAAAGRFRQGGS